MKKNSLFVYVTNFFFLFLTLETVAFVEKARTEDVINWKCQNYFQSVQSMTNMNDFLDTVKQKSNGRLVIKGYSANQLVKTKGVLNTVAKGGIEMGWGAGIYHRGKIPEAALEFGLDFSWQTWDEQKELFYKYGILEKIRKAYAEHGIYYLSPLPGNRQQ